MAAPKVYVICDSNCKYEGMTREQILTAITQAVETGTIGNCDAGFITTIKTINGQPLKFFVGDQNEYDALSASQRQNLFAIITNDINYKDILAAVNAVQESADANARVINGILKGDTVVPNANHANTATDAIRATNATNAVNATSLELDDVIIYRPVKGDLSYIEDVQLEVGGIYLVSVRITQLGAMPFLLYVWNMEHYCNTSPILDVSTDHDAYKVGYAPSASTLYIDKQKSGSASFSPFVYEKDAVVKIIKIGTVS